MSSLLDFSGRIKPVLVLRAQTCLSLLLMFEKLDFGVRAYTFFNLISEMFLCNLGVR